MWTRAVLLAAAVTSARVPSSRPATQLETAHLTPQDWRQTTVGELASWRVWRELGLRTVSIASLQTLLSNTMVLLVYLLLQAVYGMLYYTPPQTLTLTYSF